MKTPREWAKRIQNSKEPWDKLVKMIQDDARIDEIQKTIDLCDAADGDIDYVAWGLKHRAKEIKGES